MRRDYIFMTILLLKSVKRDSNEHNVRNGEHKNGEHNTKFTVKSIRSGRLRLRVARAGLPGDQKGRRNGRIQIHT